jgi:putative oxidoreductase
MSLARRAARAALAASFISGGIDQIRNPQPKAGPASPIAKPIADRVPQLRNDPESLV